MRSKPGCATEVIMMTDVDYSVWARYIFPHWTFLGTALCNRSRICSHIGEETTAQTSPSPKVNGLDLSMSRLWSCERLGCSNKGKPNLPFWSPPQTWKPHLPWHRGWCGGWRSSSRCPSGWTCAWHRSGSGWSAGSLAPTHGQVFQFQVDVSDPSFAIGSIRSQILPDALQVLHFFLLFFCCDILWFKVNQLNQGSANIHTKPRECWGQKRKEWGCRLSVWIVNEEMHSPLNVL